LTGPLHQRERVRFHDFTFERRPDGRCRARVDLAWVGEQHYYGEAEGVASDTGEMRCAATAALAALGKAVASRSVQLDLLGVKSVRAFDSIVVVVALSATDGTRSTRLVGSYLTEADVPRGAALAVLNATNRFLGNLLATS
jgi:hypothetical protein